MKISSTIARAAPFSAPTLFRGTIEQGIQRSGALGFDGVELQLNLLQEDPIDFAYVRALCEQQSVRVSAYATGSLYTQSGLSLSSPDAAVIQQALEMLYRYVDAAATTGGKVIIGCIRGNTDKESPLQLCINRLAPALQRLLDYAAKKDVKVVLEAINRFENNYLATAAQCVEFIEDYRLYGLEILLDTFHMNMEETSFQKAIETAGDLLGHVHLADNTRKVPGSGMLDFDAVLTQLERQQYNNWLSFECGVMQKESPEAVSGLQYIRQLLKMEAAS